MLTKSLKNCFLENSSNYQKAGLLEAVMLVSALLPGEFGIVGVS